MEISHPCDEWLRAENTRLGASAYLDTISIDTWRVLRVHMYVLQTARVVHMRDRESLNARKPCSNRAFCNQRKHVVYAYTYLIVDASCARRIGPRTSLLKCACAKACIYFCARRVTGLCTGISGGACEPHASKVWIRNLSSPASRGLGASRA